MRKTIMKFVRTIIPDNFYLFLKNRYIRHKNTKHHSRAKETSLTLSRFTISIPSNHSLIKFHGEQPKRDLALGTVAHHIGKKYPDKPIVDIGANIGDTAAIMASECANDMILVEASDFFFPYLEKNAALFPNLCTLHHCLVVDGSRQTGSLLHWGGTAYFQSMDNGKNQESKSLEDITNNACFVKTDTDGFDFRIINGNIDILAKMQPALMFENQIRNQDDVTECGHVLDNLGQIGYRYYCLFDDQGYLLFSTENIAQLKQMNLFMYAQFSDNLRKKSISNFDVFCFHEKDGDVFKTVIQEYKTLMEKS